MACDDVRAALSGFDVCVETEDGSRVTTHCMYPSFEPVNVFVARYGNGFRVHDGGGATRSAWVHGRDSALITRMLNRYASRYQIAVVEDALVADASSVDWLASAILAVANASAGAAHAALERVVAAAEAVLKDKILSVLRQTVAESAIRADFQIVGRSGKMHRFDFGVTQDRRVIIIDAVSPHHISIASKYVAFADSGRDADYPLQKFAVHDRPLETDDVALLSQVADLVPVASLQPGMRRALSGKDRGLST